MSLNVELCPPGRVRRPLKKSQSFPAPRCASPPEPIPRRRTLSISGLTAEPTIAKRRLLGFSRKASPWDSEQPIREELFSVERLETHARSLAVAQTVAAHADSRPASGRADLPTMAAVLLSAYRSIVEAIDDGRAITPAAEWLIDNYHLVERQIRQISTDLPPGYYRQLPKLVTGSVRGLSPRLRHGLGVCRAHRQQLSIPTSSSPMSRPIRRCSRSRSASFGRSRSRCRSS